MSVSVFVLVYGCWVECRAAARILLTSSHINSADLASDNGEKWGVKKAENKRWQGGESIRKSRRVKSEESTRGLTFYYSL